MSADLSRASTGAAGLRPLSIGELFDRAVSIYLHHVLTFASLLFVVVVPMAITYYFSSHDALDATASLIEAAVKHSSTPPDLSKLDTIPLFSPWTGLYYAIFVFGLPLANAAVVSGVSRAYLGMPVRFRACYADAYHRWGYVLILTILWGVALVVLIFVSFFAILFVAILIGLLSALKTFGFIAAGIIGIVFGLAFLALLVIGYMAFAASFIACVLEKTDPVRSFTLGFTRLFGGGLFWRSTGVAFSILLIGMITSVIASVAGGLAFYFTKSAFTYVAIAQLFNVFFLAFAFVLVALYYYDIRIRREGFDLQLLAEQLASSAAAPAAAAPPAQ